MSVHPTQSPIRHEFHELGSVRQRLADASATWHDVVLQDVDLRPVDDELSRRDLLGCHFLGCEIGPKVATAIAQSETAPDPRQRCLVFPRLPWLPFNPYRGTLYQAEELLGRFVSDDPDSARRIYAESVDWRSYASFAQTDPAQPDYLKLFKGDSLDTVLARRLHDTSITNALENLLEKARQHQQQTRQGGVVAIMGGHDMRRMEKIKNASLPAKPLGEHAWEGMSDDSVYARVALVAWQLTRLGYLLVSGGGPGAMEACNLGAYFATRSLDELRQAIRLLEAFPKFVPGQSAEWLLPAMSVRRRFPPLETDDLRGQSVGIPTWHYGHEPPNPFASHIAKYFENSVREEGLLAIATHGVIFAEGNAGTVQEIFQDACQNYYATYGTAAPMILFGQDYWDPPAMPAHVNDKRKKVFPLVRKLAEEKGFTHRLIVTDSLAEIVRMITAFKP